jgi:hypothetical protein
MVVLTPMSTVMMTSLAPLILAMLNKDVSSLLLFAMIPMLARTMNVMPPLVSAILTVLVAMTTMLVLLILAVLSTDANTVMLNVMTTMLVLMTPVMKPKVVSLRIPLLNV